MAGPIGTAIQGKYDKEAAKKNRRYAEQQQRAGMQLINELDFEPMYASERVPTYQRSKSPVASSYIDSFLMGNNPDAIRSSAPNAALKRASAQASQNRMFGTPQERMRQQQEVYSQTPWQVTPPTRRVQDVITPQADWTVQNSELASAGIDKGLSDALAETGLNLPALMETRNNRKKSGLDAYLKADMSLGAIDDLLKGAYGGDKQRLAADIRAAGGLEALYRQQQKRGR